MGAASTTNLQSLVEELAAKHKVPGATAAIFDGDRVTEAATGVISKSTGVDVTTNTLFQIGSITKVFTTTLVMQLVDDAQIELDKPVRDYLPELKLADPQATESVTVRQLLSHSSGLNWGSYEDTGRGDDCLRKYVATLGTLRQISAPGTMFSYSNAGFIVAGRLVEQVTGQTWDAALKERLLDPLGLQRTVTLPEEAIMHRAAVGHIDPTNSGEPTPAPMWVLPRSLGPSGLIISTANELLSFARLHLDDGVAQNGTTVVSKESVLAMQEQQVESPNRFLPACGLGWMLFDWTGQKVIGHDGGTIGQAAFLRIVPKARFAVALLTNSYTGMDLSRELFRRLFAERVGINVPDMPKAADGVEFDASSYAGTYERSNMRIRVEAKEGDLVASIDWGETLDLVYPPVTREPLNPIDDTTFLIRAPREQPLVFFDFDESGSPRYIHTLGAASPRVN